MIEALLLVLAIGHYGYEPLAAVLGVSEPRVFYVFQGAVGAGFFLVAGLTLSQRIKWLKARDAFYLIALWGLFEQLLVVGCGCARLWAPTFRARSGEGLCGWKWYGIGMAAVAWLAVLAWQARNGRLDR